MNDLEVEKKKVSAIYAVILQAEYTAATVNHIREITNARSIEDLADITARGVAK